MIEDEGALKPSATDRYSETLVYDFAKFLTSASLLVLGGVLALLPSFERGAFELHNLVLVLVLVSLGGATALSTANYIVDARAAGKQPTRHLRRYLQAAVAFIGIGTGAFLMLWWDSLK